MFWLDQVVDDIIQAYPDKGTSENPFIIRDEKTLSGRVHVGSLRGVVIHGLVAQALNERGKKAKFLFEFNDADPMDGLPVYLDEKVYRQHMGKPLKDVPAPQEAPEGHKGPWNYAEYYGIEFLKVINMIGFYPEIVRASQQYGQGTYDQWIEKALLSKEKIRTIYREVSGSEKSEDWYPLQVICEKCGKVGTTKVTGFDGQQVTYHCMPDMVKWAAGCDYKGKMSPFWSKGGRGKLPWKVEWPVKWLGYGVGIEGAGKDHCAAGGSHDVGDRICQEVFGGKTPFNIPYEFFLFEGAKMSSSKGMGATAHEMSQSIPPELLRFLLTKSQPQTPINFNADGETIPRLFDDYDKVARVFFGEEEGHEDNKKLFHFTCVNEESARKRYFPRFSRIAFLVQIPHLDMIAEVEKLKGAPLTQDDTKEAKLRSEYAIKWLEKHATESQIFKVFEERVPEKAAELSSEQKQFLNELADLLEQFEKENKLTGNARGEALHAKIHEHRKSSTLEAREGFGAIYMALIGKNSGPQAGWFLEALEPKFVIERFRAVAALKAPEKKELQLIETKFLRIDPAVQAMFPQLQWGAAMIQRPEGNEDTNGASAGISALAQEIIASLNLKDLKKNSKILAEYKAMFKKFGVDPTKRKPNPVALIDRLVNGKDFQHINPVVDVANLMSMKYQLSCSVFDAEKIALPLTLRFTQHGETFEGKTIQKGELVYSDAKGIIVRQDYNHRDLPTVDNTTKKVFVLIDGNRETGKELIEKALNEVCEKLGGKTEEKEMIA
jgi:lysyl-tRNA synthetase class 1